MNQAIRSRRGRILIIEEDEGEAAGLKSDLEVEGYAVDWLGDGLEGLRLAQDQALDLVILELELPELDGFQLLRCLRRRGAPVPALVLSRRDAVAEKVLSLQNGADDYVTKPYGVQELLARVEALIRRTRMGPARISPRPGLIFFGDVEVDPASHKVFKGGAAVDLSPKEFALLLALADRGGAAVSRSELLEKVWNPDSLDSSRTVDTHICGLRRKLEDNPSSPRHLLTVRKVGYRLRLR